MVRGDIPACARPRPEQEAECDGPGLRTDPMRSPVASPALTSSSSSKDLTEKTGRMSLGPADGRATLVNRRISPMNVDLSSGVAVPNYHRTSLDLPARNAPGFEQPSRASMSAAPGTSYATNPQVARTARYALFLFHSFFDGFSNATLTTRGGQQCGTRCLVGFTVGSDSPRQRSSSVGPYVSKRDADLAACCGPSVAAPGLKANVPLGLSGTRVGRSRRGIRDGDTPERSDSPKSPRANDSNTRSIIGTPQFHRQRCERLGRSKALEAARPERRC